jgi:hypothetical protein
LCLCEHLGLRKAFASHVCFHSYLLASWEA